METRKLTPRQLSKLWGIPTPKVLAWIRSGDLRAINAAVSKSGERPRWLIDVSDIEAFERSRAAAPPKPAPQKRRSRKPTTTTTPTTYF